MRASGDRIFDLTGLLPETIFLLRIASVLTNKALNTLVPELLNMKVIEVFGDSSLETVNMPPTHSQARNLRKRFKAAVSMKNPFDTYTPNSYLREQAIKIIDENGNDGLSAQLLNKYRSQQQAPEAAPHLQSD